MSEAALALIEQADNDRPSALMQRALDVAATCKMAVLSSVVTIRGQRHVKVEGWCTIATAYGCMPSIRNVVEEDRGIRSVAVLKRADGLEVSEAVGFCGLDEPEWSNKAMYARMSMAQTRAISRVCRTAFAFVLKLIDAEISTTPAEEIPATEAPPITITSTATSRPLTSVSSSTTRPAAERSPGNKVRYGNKRGQYLCDITEEELAWCLTAAKKGVAANDPKWHESNEKYLAAIQDEVARREA